VARARPGEVPRVGARRPWPAEVTRLGARQREVAWRELLSGDVWAALAVSAQLGAR
jgi:predicted small integral membrane protein